jgi:uncharacterized protein (UPF0332 family)
MNYQKQDLINYRLHKSSTTFGEAKVLAQSGFWGGAANRLYYRCFYSVIALLTKDNISVSTHNGVRTEFFKLYIKTGILDKRFGSLYSNLMGNRQESDYSDFHDFSKEEISPLFDEVEIFLTTLKDLINSWRWLHAGPIATGVLRKKGEALIDLPEENENIGEIWLFFKAYKKDEYSGDQYFGVWGCKELDTYYNQEFF